MIQDTLNRSFKKLRLSITDSCNLSCVYCTEDDEPVERLQPIVPHVDTGLLLQKVKQLHHIVGFDTVRVTGGEPFLNNDIIAILEYLASISIPNIKITTNGFYLKRHLAVLSQIPVCSINISLDTLRESVFNRISRRKHLQVVLKAIDAALEYGINIKLNTVVYKGINETDIVPLLNFAAQRNITIRYIELMKMGHIHQSFKQHFYGQDAILKSISEKYRVRKLPREYASTANYWQTNEGVIFGIIANESEPFCSDCNRLRMDSKGFLYGCLSKNEGYSIMKKDSSEELQNVLTKCMAQKQMHTFTGSSLSMRSIGG